MNSHLVPDMMHELGAWVGDGLGPCLASGGTPAVPGSGLTLAAFATNGYVRTSGGDLVYVRQPALAVTLAGSDGAYWLALHRDTSTAVAGWTRRPGSHYLWRSAATHPGHPSQALTFALLTVSGSAITAIDTSLAPGPMRAGPGVINACGDYGTLNAAVAAAGSRPATLMVHATLHVTASVTIPKTLMVQFEAPGKLEATGAVTATCAGAIDAPEMTLFGVNVTPRLQATSVLYARWFGAQGDDSTDDAVALQRTFTAATTSGRFWKNATVVLGAGVFRVSTTLALADYPGGVLTITGTYPSSHQAASSGVITMLRFTGGAEPCIRVGANFVNFYGFAMDNVGTGTYGILVENGAGRTRMDMMSFSLNNDTQIPFSEVIVRFASGGGYSKISNIEYVDAAVKGFVEIAPGNFTTLSVRDSVFDTNGNIPTAQTVVLLDVGATVDVINLERNTVNGNGPYELRLFDSSSIGTGQVAVVTIRESEFDPADGWPSTYRFVRATNVDGVFIEGNQIHGGGTMGAFATGLNSHFYVKGNSIRSLAGPIVFIGDTTSRVFAEHNTIYTNRGITPNSPSLTGIVNVPYGTAVRLHGEHGHPGAPTVYKVDVTDGVAFTVSAAIYSDTDAGYMTRGQVVHLLLRNLSGGVMGAVTLLGTQFKSSGAVVAPANGYSRTLTFVYDGAYMVELARSAADVPN